MLGPDVVMAESSSFINSELNDLFCSWREANLPRGSAFTSADDELHRGSDFGQFYSEARKNLGGYSVRLANKAEQNMLRANIVVIEALSFFLGQGKDSACPLREFFEPACHYQFLLKRNVMVGLDLEVCLFGSLL